MYKLLLLLLDVVKKIDCLVLGLHIQRGVSVCWWGAGLVFWIYTAARGLSSEEPGVLKKSATYGSL